MMIKWNERYNSDEYYYGTEPNDFLKAEAHRIAPGGNVLCLAEGEGRNAVYLATLGFQVTAMDGSSIGLEKLQRLAASRGVEVRTVVADLADFSIEPETYDAIISIWCHLPETLRQKVHQRSARGLKKNGLFILEAYHPRQLNYKTGGPSTADLLMTTASLREELKGLRFEVLRETDRDVREGKGHHGQSAVVQVVAVRES